MGSYSRITIANYRNLVEAAMRNNSFSPSPAAHVNWNCVPMADWPVTPVARCGRSRIPFPVLLLVALLLVACESSGGDISKYAPGGAKAAAPSPVKTPAPAATFETQIVAPTPAPTVAPVVGAAEVQHVVTDSVLLDVFGIGGGALVLIGIPAFLVFCYAAFVASRVWAAQSAQDRARGGGQQ